MHRRRIDVDGVELSVDAAATTPPRRAPRARSASQDGAALGKMSPRRRRAAAETRQALVAWLAVLALLISCSFLAPTRRHLRGGDAVGGGGGARPAEALAGAARGDAEAVPRLGAPPVAPGAVVGGYAFASSGGRVAAPRGAARGRRALHGGAAAPEALPPPPPPEAPGGGAVARVVVRWRFTRRVNRGAHGEVWRGEHAATGGAFVLKRMFLEKGGHVREAAAREVFFGEALRGARGVAGFVERFRDGGDLWLVFEDAGVTLHDYAFSPTSSGLLEPSESWRVRRSAEGPAWFRDRGGSRGRRELHGRGVVHRDLKPRTAWSPAAEAAGLFGDFGPSREEETVEYMPPEVLFADEDTFYAPAPAYDAWSLGVLLLELLLGTRQALTVDQRTRGAELAAAARGARGRRARAAPRGARGPLHLPGVAACGDDDFAGELQRRDPLEIGYDRFLGVDGVDLLRRLLAHDPRDRLLPADALASHAFFRRDQARALAGDAAVALDAREYRVPGLRRAFGVWESCRVYAAAKRPGAFCVYDASTLPGCLSTHALLPDDPRSGFCDVKGRRETIEDHYAVAYRENFTLWGVFDGHEGREAARYAAHALPRLLEENADLRRPRAPTSRPRCGADGRAVDASYDHVAADAAEAARIVALGGAVDASGAVPRVEGRVVVTRSIGNRDLAKYLVPEPHLFVAESAAYEFLILATDGLWDTTSSDEAVRFVRARLAAAAASPSRDQDAATALTHEALVRQSQDNIGVCVIDLRNRSACDHAV
ncbi:cyclin-dependent protein serine/threonine kinase [Aureococcus anophagefferens]|nr:cyclin-dependent protein serine/threonine kinase [Aureococcus anophagefferens]